MVMQIPSHDSEVPRISPETLKKRIDSGEDILIADVRSVNSYRAQHLPGAISVPLKKVASRLDEFPRDKLIVFY
jgi:rhodanese-related sulfurtransferase